MSEESDIPPERPSPLDPSIVRGLTARRYSRRDVLRAAGLGVGALGAGALLEACGGTGSAAKPAARAVKGAPGSAEWWSKQKLNHVVNFANWPLYIDVLNGKHPSLEHFTATTGIKVNYTEPIDNNAPFYVKIRPELEAKQYTGFDLIVVTTNAPQLGYLIDQGWLIPLDHSMMTNFEKYAGPLVKNPAWDPGNKYTMAWQSGWTAIGYNSSVVKDPGDSVGILFDKKYAGKVGMMSDPQELGSVGLLALGIEPAKSTESDWAKAAKLLQKQKSDGIVRAYYDQSYIDRLKAGDIVVSQAWSGDIFQADLSSKYRNLKLLMPKEGAMFWTDNMCIPMYARNPKDAMTLMDYVYQPGVQAVIEYYNDYVCPVPKAKQALLHPTGWTKATLERMRSSIGEPPSVTADAPTVFPDAHYVALSRPYFPFKSQDEVTAWNNLFLPIIEGS
ncbi:MAG TPA: spermidine/putrescine ABC transporter substrate-binding protein [Solirubrobacteraceae bacterium]|nr:spermidine/putrescine ABC transporter substrate-binding protein [Solirubrobacteraceae bacterium]